MMIEVTLTFGQRGQFSFEPPEPDKMFGRDAWHLCRAVNSASSTCSDQMLHGSFDDAKAERVSPRYNSHQNPCFNRPTFPLRLCRIAVLLIRR
jgi:hypothetical protein